MLQKSSELWIRVGIVIVTVAFVFYVLPLALPFILSLVLALVLYPLVACIEKIMGKYLKVRCFPRWIAIFITYAIVTVIVVFILNHTFEPFITEFIRFINNLPFLLMQFAQVLVNIQDNYLHMNLPAQVTDLINMTVIRLGNYSVDIVQKVVETIFSVAGFMVELLLVPILTFYMLKDGRLLSEKFVSLFSHDSSNGIRNILHKCYISLGGYLRGELLLAVNMFCVVLIAMYLFGVPYPLVLALLAGFAEWIPIIGPIVGATPAIILASLISVPLAIKVAIFYICVQLIDGQIIMPKVFGRVISLHPLIIIAVIFIGGSLYGVKGMMLAVPVTAVLQIVAGELWYYNSNFKRKDNTNERE